MDGKRIIFITKSKKQKNGNRKIKAKPFYQTTLGELVDADNAVDAMNMLKISAQSIANGEDCYGIFDQKVKSISIEIE